MAVAKSVKLTFTAANGTQNFVPARCHFHGFLLGMDGSNDPTITIYDNSAATASGDEVVPSATYDASALGLNGALPGIGVVCESGITADVSISAGNCEITVYFS